MADLVRFTECMSGRLSPRVTEAHRLAERGGDPGYFVLTVVTPDVDAMVANARHRNRAYGCVVLPALHPLPLAVEHGFFDLFVEAPGADRAYHMHYQLRLRDDEGRRYFLRGLKEVSRRRWVPTMPMDTTTLFTDVFAGDDDTGEPLLRGVLRMGPLAVTMQGLSFRGEGAWLGLRGIARFMGYYMARVWQAYTAPRRVPRLWTS
ncbi:MAG: hypothetical protein FJ102_17880 [Deltaproteobacteria bacterium]|nr:hypothetical protein [Deltaproteobacteria bacterium]